MRFSGRLRTLEKRMPTPCQEVIVLDADAPDFEERFKAATERGSRMLEYMYVDMQGHQERGPVIIIDDIRRSSIATKLNV